MKYEVGDRVWIKRGAPYWNQRMDDFVGSVMTIRDVNELNRYYKMEEDINVKTGNDSPGWDWFENMIDGLAEESADVEMKDPKYDGSLNAFLNNFKT